MATTRKRPESKIKMIKEVEVIPPVREVEINFLMPEDLKCLEVFGRDVENAKLLMALEEQSLANMLLQFELLQNKIEKQRILVSTKAKNYQNSAEKFIAYKKEIWPKYGLAEQQQMGYDPISGEIKK